MITTVGIKITPSLKEAINKVCALVAGSEETQVPYYDDYGNYCVVGACAEVAGVKMPFRHPNMLLEDLVRELFYAIPRKDRNMISPYSNYYQVRHDAIVNYNDNYDKYAMLQVIETAATRINAR